MSKTKVKLYSNYFNLGGMTNTNPAAGLNIQLPGLIGGLRSTVNTIGNKLSGLNLGNSVMGMGANLAGNLIAGGNESNVGNFLLSAGGIVGMANPIIGGAVGLAGGLFNAAFGSKLNKEFIALTESNINQLRNYLSDAVDTTGILNDYLGFNKLGHVSKSLVGSDGWFSNKAKKKTRALNRGIDEANARALLSLDNTAENIETEQDFNIMQNYTAAYGGPIHIKKENRGKFTDYCGGNVTNECIQRGLGSPNPLTRKRANFARNARGWKHENGGLMNNIKAEGGLLDNNFTNGLIFVGNGGTHEENPNEGVLMGMDELGIPNLVEEGEVVFNDYVFSKRIKAPTELLEMVHLPSKYGGKSFAYIAKKLGEESKERPNDPISKRGLEDSMNKLRNAQEIMRLLKLIGQEGDKNKYAKGGDKSSIYTPFESWMMNMTNNGTLKYPVLGLATQVISDINPLKLKTTLESPIDDSTSFDRWYKGTVREPEFTFSVSNDKKRSKSTKGKLSKTSNLRYAPVLGSAIGLAQGLFDKPDYSSADTIMAAANQVGNYVPVDYKPVGNYLTYTPFDRNYYLNKLDAAANALRRAIMNTSSPSRNAALLAADYNYMNSLGNLARQAEEYNLAQRERIEGFNRGTDQYNADMGLRAAMANQQASALAKNARLSGIAQAMAMRDTVDLRRNAGISANFTNLFDSLGNIGKESFAMDMIRNNPALYYDWMGNYKAACGGKLRKKGVRNG